MKLLLLAIAATLASGCSVQPPSGGLLVAAGVGSSASASANPRDAGADAGPSREELIGRALVFDLPEPGLDGRTPLILWATYYYIPQVAHAEAGFALRDMGGRALGPSLTRRDWCEAAMQGTVLIHMPDGTAFTYNYDGVRNNVEVDCKPVYPKHGAIGRTRYKLAEGPWGDGVDGMLLIPYRSIAVDRSTIRYGSLVYIPAARGTKLTLPSGKSAVHDGYFYAADRGGAIKGSHIDVFVGAGKHNPFAFVRSKRKATFDAHVMDGATAELASAEVRLRRSHRP